MKPGKQYTRNGHVFTVKDSYISNTIPMVRLINETTGGLFTLRHTDVKKAFTAMPASEQILQLEKGQKNNANL